MPKHEENLINILKNELKSRNNPLDLKPVYVGKVVGLSPVEVEIFDGEVTLTEGDDLYISEQFRLRCNIDKTTALSSDVPDLLDGAKQITETHSYTGSPCQMPSAIDKLAQAIEKVNTELLQLKCDLKVGDYVAIASLEQLDRFLLTDKVL